MAYVENQPHTITNPDGKSFDVFISGDEEANYIHDINNNKIIQGRDNYYYFAEFNDGRFIASEIRYDPTLKTIFETKNIAIPNREKRYDKRFNVPEIKNDKGYEGGLLKKFSKNIFNSDTSMHLGVLNNIIIFIRFADDPEEFINNFSHYDNIFNGDEYSVKDYFKKVSHNKVEVISTFFPTPQNNVILSYQDTYPRNYFIPKSTNNPSGYTSSERTSREHGLLKRAVEAISSKIPKDIELDSNNNGRVDSVGFIVRGNPTGWSSILWAHRWALYSHNVKIHGKRVWDFTFQPEKQSTVQISSHELFHVFGAPDLYRYVNNDISPAGRWDLMHSGGGHMTAHMKYKYSNGKWLEDIPIITEPGRYTLGSLATTGQAFRINSPNSQEEYFIVEYRNKEDDIYEANLPQRGLIIYRVNDKLNGNAQGPPDELYIYRANGTLTTNGLINIAAYHQNHNRTIISDDTNPRCFLSDDSNGEIKISHVVDNGNGTMSFNYNYDVNPDITYYNITTSIDGDGDISGAGTYPEGKEITITATFDESLEVSKWVINDVDVENTNSEITLTVESDLDIKVVLKDKTYKVNVNPQVFGSGNNHMGYFEGNGKYDLPAEVTVKAYANTGYEFLGWVDWSGNIIDDSHEIQKSYPYKENNFTSVFFGKFQKKEGEEPTYYNVTAQDSNLFTIDGLGEYEAGTEITLTVNINNPEKYKLDKWVINGEEYDNTNPLSYTIENDIEVDVILKLRKYVVSGYVTPSSFYVLEGAGEFEYGSDVELYVRTSGVNHWEYKIKQWIVNGETINAKTNHTIENISSDYEIVVELEKGNFIAEITSNYPNEVILPEIVDTYEYGDSIDVSFEIINPDKYEFVEWRRNGQFHTRAHNTNIKILENNTLIECILKQKKAMKEVNVIATPNEGWEFLNWTKNEEVVSTNPEFVYELNEDSHLVANFQKKTFVITINSSGSGSVSGDGKYDYGDEVTLIATPENNNKFVGWFIGEELISEDEEFTFIIEENTEFTAIFEEINYVLTLEASPTDGGTVEGAGTY
ncbi:MAG: InlB B-repeat-containing protein [bacterium]